MAGTIGAMGRVAGVSDDLELAASLVREAGVLAGGMLQCRPADPAQDIGLRRRLGRRPGGRGTDRLAAARRASRRRTRRRGGHERAAARAPGSSTRSTARTTSCPACRSGARRSRSPTRTGRYSARSITWRTTSCGWAAATSRRPSTATRSRACEDQALQPGVVGELPASGRAARRRGAPALLRACAARRRCGCSARARSSWPPSPRARLGAWMQCDCPDWDWLPGAALVQAAGGATNVVRARRAPLAYRRVAAGRRRDRGAAVLTTASPRLEEAHQGADERSASSSHGVVARPGLHDELSLRKERDQGLAVRHGRARSRVRRSAPVPRPSTGQAQPSSPPDRGRPRRSRSRRRPGGLVSSHCRHGPVQRRPSGRRRTAWRPPGSPAESSPSFQALIAANAASNQGSAWRRSSAARHLSSVLRESDGARSGRDQREFADPVGVGRCVERGEVGPGRVRKEVKAFDAEVLAQCLDVADDPVDAPLWQFEEDQFADMRRGRRDCPGNASRAAGHRAAPRPARRSPVRGRSDPFRHSW